MEEQILQQIVAALGKTSLSDRTIRAKAARLAKKVTKAEDITEELISDAVEDLKDIAGQMSHDISTLVKQQVEEKTKAIKAELEKDKTTSIELPEDVKEQLKSLNELKLWKEQQEKDALARIKAETRNSYIKDLKDKMKGLGCDDSDIVDLIVAQNEPDIDKVKVDDAAKSLQEIYDKKISSRIQAGVMPVMVAPTVARQMSDEDRVKALKEDIAKMNKQN